METPIAITRRRHQFDDIVLPHLDAAYNLARWIVRDAAAADDVTQSALLRAWRHFATFDGPTGLVWLLRLVRNTAYQFVDRRSRGIAAVSHAAGCGATAGGVPTREGSGAADAGLAGEPAASAIDQALVSLPVEWRECVLLREVERLTPSQIARITGVPVGTVTTRLALAREALRRDPRLRAAAAAARRLSCSTA